MRSSFSSKGSHQASPSAERVLTRSSNAVTDRLKARALAEKLKIDSLRSVDPSLLETDELVSLFDKKLGFRNYER